MDSIFSVRIVTVDYCLKKPIPNIDNHFSYFKQTIVRKVPVLRVFGSTPCGQSTCAYIHGVFPYLMLKYDGPNCETAGQQEIEQYLLMMATSIDHALNAASGNENSGHEHVYKITLLRGKPFYGYHETDEIFLKVYLYQPGDVKRVCELLQAGAIMHRSFQPHEAHIPYILQMFIDYNLYGMNFLHARSCWFRPPLDCIDFNWDQLRTNEGASFNASENISPRSSGPLKNTKAKRILTTFNPQKCDQNCKDNVFRTINHNPIQSMLSNHLSNDTDYALFSCPFHKLWNNDTIPMNSFIPSAVAERESTTELEVDILATDILNRCTSVTSAKNPGIALIWDDEKARRRERSNDSHITILSSQDRSSKDFLTEKERASLTNLHARVNEAFSGTDKAHSNMERQNPSQIGSTLPEKDAMLTKAYSQIDSNGSLAFNQNEYDLPSSSSSIISVSPVVNMEIVSQVASNQSGMWSHGSSNQTVSNSMSALLDDLDTANSKQISQVTSSQRHGYFDVVDKGDCGMVDEFGDLSGHLSSQEVEEMQSQLDETLLMTQPWEQGVEHLLHHDDDENLPQLDGASDDIVQDESVTSTLQNVPLKYSDKKSSINPVAESDTNMRGKPGLSSKMLSSIKFDPPSNNTESVITNMNKFLLIRENMNSNEKAMNVASQNKSMIYDFKFVTSSSDSDVPSDKLSSESNSGSTTEQRTFTKTQCSNLLNLAEDAHSQQCDDNNATFKALLHTNFSSDDAWEGANSSKVTSSVPSSQLGSTHLASSDGKQEDLKKRNIGSHTSGTKSPINQRESHGLQTQNNANISHVSIVQSNQKSQMKCHRKKKKFASKKVKKPNVVIKWIIVNKFQGARKMSVKLWRITPHRRVTLNPDLLKLYNLYSPKAADIINKPSQPESLMTHIRRYTSTRKRISCKSNRQNTCPDSLPNLQHALFAGDSIIKSNDNGQDRPENEIYAINVDDNCSNTFQKFSQTTGSSEKIKQQSQSTKCQNDSSSHSQWTMDEVRDDPKHFISEDVLGYLSYPSPEPEHEIETFSPPRPWSPQPSHNESSENVNLNDDVVTADDGAFEVDAEALLDELKVGDILNVNDLDPGEVFDQSDTLLSSLDVLLDVGPFSEVGDDQQSSENAYSGLSTATVASKSVILKGACVVDLAHNSFYRDVKDFSAGLHAKKLCSVDANCNNKLDQCAVKTENFRLPHASFYPSPVKNEQQRFTETQFRYQNKAENNIHIKQRNEKRKQKSKPWSSKVESSQSKTEKFLGENLFRIPPIQVLHTHVHHHHHIHSFAGQPPQLPDTYSDFNSSEFKKPTTLQKFSILKKQSCQKRDEKYWLDIQMQYGLPWYLRNNFSGNFLDVNSDLNSTQSSFKTSVANHKCKNFLPKSTVPDSLTTSQSSSLQSEKVQKRFHINEKLRPAKSERGDRMKKCFPDFVSFSTLRGSINRKHLFGKITSNQSNMMSQRYRSLKRAASITTRVSGGKKYNANRENLKTCHRKSVGNLRKKVAKKAQRTKLIIDTSSEGSSCCLHQNDDFGYKRKAINTSIVQMDDEKPAIHNEQPDHCSDFNYYLHLQEVKELNEIRSCHKFDHNKVWLQIISDPEAALLTLQDSCNNDLSVVSCTATIPQSPREGHSPLPDVASKVATTQATENSCTKNEIPFIGNDTNHNELPIKETYTHNGSPEVAGTNISAVDCKVFKIFPPPPTYEEVEEYAKTSRVRPEHSEWCPYYGDPSDAQPMTSRLASSLPGYVKPPKLTPTTHQLEKFNSGFVDVTGWRCVLLNVNLQTCLDNNGKTKKTNEIDVFGIDCLKNLTHPSALMRVKPCVLPPNPNEVESWYYDLLKKQTLENKHKGVCNVPVHLSEEQPTKRLKSTENAKTLQDEAASSSNASIVALKEEGQTQVDKVDLPCGMNQNTCTVVPLRKSNVSFCGIPSQPCLESTPVGALNKKRPSRVHDVQLTPIATTSATRNTKFYDKSYDSQTIVEKNASNQSYENTVVEAEHITSALPSLHDDATLARSEITAFAAEGGQFLASQKDLNDAKALHEDQHIVLMSMELHVKTRINLKPDYEFDEIRAVFYKIQTGNWADLETGCIMTDTNVNLKSKLKQSAVTNLKVKIVNDECSILSCIANLLLLQDPDILIGYEVQMLSWGYLFSRAKHLGFDLCRMVSRVPDDRTHNRHDADRDAFGADNSSEIHVVGRIVLNLWRLMQPEVALCSYTFESVAYHLLHERHPLYTHRTLTLWFDDVTQHSSCNFMRSRVVDYYMCRVIGNLRLLKQQDMVGRTSELARLFGIQFYEVLTRGSQFRVEGMMLRLAHSENYITVTPGVKQRASQKAPECIPLVMEPESRYYAEPVIVLDFQSLYPSMIIAYNYCFSTCMGRTQHLSKILPGESFPFGCTSYSTTVPTLRNLLKKNTLTVAPNGVAYVKAEVKRGILPIMLEEILNTRIMVKASMKKCTDSATKKMLDHRQLGLKLIANVTYGYTSASFSGRMPCVEIADSIVHKARETLERAIRLVHGNYEKWQGRVVYGDTDSMFIALEQGTSKKRAFEVAREIVAAVTDDNPKPVKLKFEKVYQPCILQTKKRYVGYAYESESQKEPIFDAKGIETVRRDGCPAVSKIVEKSLHILFTTRDVSQVKTYVKKQCAKLLDGSSTLQDCVIAKEYRGAKYYKPDAVVPSLLLARKLTVTDKRAEPRIGERVPYVIVHGAPGTPLYRLIRQPHELLLDPSLRLNGTYYVTKMLLPALDRLMSLLGVDVFQWYSEFPRLHRYDSYAADELQSVAEKQSYKKVISHYFGSQSCLSCGRVTNQKLCLQCVSSASGRQTAAVMIMQRIRRLERKQDKLSLVCRSCTNASSTAAIKCQSLCCPVLYKRAKFDRSKSKIKSLRDVLKHHDLF
ncbi:DNA polymerase zeta catalytic subunit-like isoform X2 [Clavelina lepadiformis]|uniref:DNA polymerase zeta catalytic subunit-like isoform X2 n=1 Tax=Clavelina lepadiformis TaxID=159417 RepID=UPI004042120E